MVPTSGSKEQQPLLGRGLKSELGVTSSMSPSCNGKTGSKHSQSTTNHIGVENQGSIAIIGMSCRFAGDATSASKLWELCIGGKSAWSSIPGDRFKSEAFYDPDPERPGRHHVRGGHFYKDDPAYFDAAFFNMSSDTASAMDPQIRHLLEIVYEATEDAGIPLEKLSGSNTSVTAGCFGRDYYQLLMHDPETMPRHTMTSSSMTMLSNRVSHFFDLHGPSVSVDTACSTSLVALHQGCQTILLGESELAIVGASCALLNPDMFIAQSIQGVLGPEGKCRALDDSAVGYGRGEGVASLILKRLDAALRDGDRVHAVIRGTAMNQSGRTPTISSPSVEAQVKLIRDCYSRAGLDMGDTGFVEGHLTGTSVGDPIEAEAIARTFGKSRPAGSPPVLLGSVKTNLGHTEAASGLASLIKTVFVLKTGLIPPNLHFKAANPNIPLQEWNLAVPTSATPWPQGFPFRASVSNFGFGGTNVHLILEKAPPQDRKARTSSSIAGENTMAQNGNANSQNGHSTFNDDDIPYVFVTSAKDASAAELTVRRLEDYLLAVIGTKNEPIASDLAYTMNERRTRFPWVITLRAKTLPELVDQCRRPGLKSTHSTKVPRVGYVFNGNGAQWYGMGRELLSAYPVFSQSIYMADAELRKLGLSWSLRGMRLQTRLLTIQVVFTRLPEELLRTEPPTGSTLHENTETQIRLGVVVGALQIGLVDLLESWGIRPSGVASHSMGEVAAAYAVGALTLEQAMGITLLRSSIFLGRKMHLSGGGGMLAAAVSSEVAARYISELTCGGCLVVACVNSPVSVTLSGDISALDEVEHSLTRDGILVRRLNVSIPFHSPLLLPLVPEYTDRISALLPETCCWGVDGPVFASPVTGGIIDPREGLPFDHWVHNLVQPTLFSSGLDAMVFGTPVSQASDPAQRHIDLIIEIGAHSQLATPIQQCLSQHGVKAIPYVSCLKRSVNAVDTMQNLAAYLVSNGYNVDLAAVNTPRPSSSLSFVPDLPLYPWTHGKRYWSTSRLVHEHKFPRYPAHELLGLPVAGSNPLTPTWRHFLRLSDESLPWLVDHKIGDTVVFPGAGYMSMAIEAARLAIDPSEATIQAYKLRDVEITHALQIPSSGTGVEILFQMERCSDEVLGSDEWWDFKISSARAPGQTNEVVCVEHCRGSVSVEKAAMAGSLMKNSFRSVAEDVTEISHPNAQEQAGKVKVDQLFAGLREMGIHHGPAFQNLTTLHAAAAERRAVCDFVISETASPNGEAAKRSYREYPLHPTTLDSAFLVGYAALDDGMRKDVFYVPRSIGAMYVPRDIKRSAGGQLKAFASLASTREGHGFTVASTIVDASRVKDHSCAIRIDRLFCQAIPKEDKIPDNPSLSSLNRGKMIWVPDILRDMPVAIRDTIQQGLTDKELDWEKRIRRGAYYLIRDAVSQLDGESQDSWAWNHKKLMAWMNIIVNLSGAASGLGSTISHTWADDYHASDPEHRREFLERLRSESIPGQLTCCVGDRLADIVRGHVTPLELMMADNLLEKYYEVFPCIARSYQHMQTIVSTFASKNPGAKVLEIGAGTGGATTFVLNALSNTSLGNEDVKSTPCFAHYDYTDISAGFFEAARRKFAAWTSQGLMSFKRLNIETELETQSDFGPNAIGAYDLVIASMVLHSTASLKRTMQNVHKLLRPNGTLVMLECTRDRLDSQLIFGTLPGWWLSKEPERNMSPMASLDDWDSVLRTTGFTGGVEIHLEDCEVGKYQTNSVLVTTATPCKTFYPDSFTVVYVDLPPPAEWLAKVRHVVRSYTSAEMHLKCLANLDCDPVENEVCVFVGEIGGPILHEMNSNTFNKVRHLLINCRGILWVTCGGAVDGTQPELALAQGLLRTVRQEDRSKRCILLDLGHTNDPNMIWTNDRARDIACILRASFDFGVNQSDVEFEYAAKNGILYIPRVIRDLTPDESNTTVLEPFQKPERDLVLRHNPGGSLNGMYFAETNISTADLPAGFVEIEPCAFGLNFRDVLIVLGEVDGEPIFGRECSGLVSRLGPETTESGLRIGDRVCAMCATSCGTRQRARWQCVLPIPNDLSWTEAAIIPIAYGTAWIALQKHARLQKGESVLIHAATGGFGQAALTLAQYMGAGTIFATCSTPEKRDLLVREYGLRSDHIFSSRSDEFALGIMEKTRGKGVDIIINSLSGRLFKASWDIIARHGRFIDVGKRDTQAGRHINMRPFGRGAIMSAVDFSRDVLEPSSGGRPYLAREAIATCIDLLSAGSIRMPVPLTEYCMSEMEKAMRLMQTGKHLGKMVLVPKSNDMVKVKLRQRPFQLSHDVSYLVVGGTRGIGAMIARWLIQKGAKHLVVLSRNAKGTEGASALIQTALEKECNVHLHDCDIGDEKAFVDFLAAHRECFPPIRGIITGAMVLDDTILESMSFEQWQAAVRPKVNGTMNLHTHLGDNVEFFIMLSSLTGITGNVSQANYAAGNAFQDALARHRTKLGKPAVVLDLGIVADVGYVATAGQAIADRTLNRFGGGPIDTTQILSLIEDAVRYPCRSSPDDAQVLVGIPQDIPAPNSAFAVDKRFANLQRVSTSDPSQGASTGSEAKTSQAQIISLLKTLAMNDNILSPDQTMEITSTLITLKLREMFSLGTEQIDISLPPSHYGIDSLVGVELRNWLAFEMKAKVSIFEIVQSHSIAKFAGLVAARIKQRNI